ncbi:MAG: helix-turn-helix transcriptional regulator [Clostridia bacterium]|nr:helix-turn-helix transcriptional regulator [Clostridia bacterium]
MEIFKIRLQEFIDEKECSKEELSNALELSSASVVSSWTTGRKIPRFNNAIKIADYFCCSLDYLFGFTDNNDKTKFNKSKNFAVQLKKILKDKKITQAKLVEETNFSKGNISSWLYSKSQPDMPTVIRLAKYLNVSLDYLAGRE